MSDRYDGKEKPVRNHLCAYSDNGQQCTLTGGLADSTRCGESTSWYCAHHFNWFEDPRAASLALTGILNGEITENRTSWREEALHEKGLQLKKSNPELFVKNATNEEIAEVNLSFIRSLKSKNIQLPYNKNKSLNPSKGYADDEVLIGYQPVATPDSAT